MRANNHGVDGCKNDSVEERRHSVGFQIFGVPKERRHSNGATDSKLRRGLIGTAPTFACIPDAHFAE
jgi:hypothetical protein